MFEVTALGNTEAATTKEVLEKFRGSTDESFRLLLTAIALGAIARHGFEPAYHDVEAMLDAPELADAWIELLDNTEIAEPGGAFARAIRSWRVR